MKATLLLKDKIFHKGCIIEWTVWQLPEKTETRPYELKYRLSCTRGGICLVRYDNERGKGDHVHYGLEELCYAFRFPEQLLLDFDNDIDRLTR